MNMDPQRYMNMCSNLQEIKRMNNLHVPTYTFKSRLQHLRVTNAFSHAFIVFLDGTPLSKNY